MKIEIKPAPVFQKASKKLSKKYRSFADDIKSFIEELRVNPNAGTSLGSGIRKVRCRIKSKGKGKSGSARIITYTVIIADHRKNIYLYDIYDKSDLSTKDTAAIKKAINKYFKDFSNLP